MAMSGQRVTHSRALDLTEWQWIQAPLQGSGKALDKGPESQKKKKKNHQPVPYDSLGQTAGNFFQGWGRLPILETRIDDENNWQCEWQKQLAVLCSPAIPTLEGETEASCLKNNIKVWRDGQVGKGACKRENLSLNPSTDVKTPDMAGCTWNPITVSHRDRRLTGAWWLLITSLIPDSVRDCLKSIGREW